VTGNQIWLCAEYHFPTDYSLRVPLSSATSALALPAPGPATVRLAIIRVGIELFGVDQVRDKLFPIIRAIPVRIKPPARVAISKQFLQLIKVSDSGQSGQSVGYREVAQADGAMSVFINVPDHTVNIFTRILWDVGYWGQASSLTCCLGVSNRRPQPGECATSLATAWKKSSRDNNKRAAFTCLATEFRDHHVSWREVVTSAGNNVANAVVKPEIYIWPLQIIEQYSSHKLLIFQSIY